MLELSDMSSYLRCLRHRIGISRAWDNADTALALATKFSWKISAAWNTAVFVQTKWANTDPSPELLKLTVSFKDTLFVNKIYTVKIETPKLLRQQKMFTWVEVKI